MKKRTVLLLTLALLVTAVGCGKKDKTTDNVEQTSDTKVEVSVSDETETTEATETSSTSNSGNSGIYFDNVEEVFQDKYLGIQADTLYTSYTVKWGKAPVYFSIPENEFFGVYDFGEDFIAISYDEIDHSLLRVYMGDAKSFDADKYIRDEYKERFNITDPEVSYMTEDNDGETLEIPFTYYTSVVGHNENLDNCWASYGTWTIKDEDTGTEYVAIILNGDTFEYGMAHDIYNLTLENDVTGIKFSHDPTYLTGKSYETKGDGIYTLYLYDLDKHINTDSTITFKVPEKFISTDFRSKDMSYFFGELGIFKKDYGIIGIAPYSSAFKEENFKKLKWGAHDFVDVSADFNYTEVESNYRNGYIFTETYETESFERSWTYEENYSYDLANVETDYYYASKEYPLTILFHPIDSYDMTLEEFKQLVDEVLDAGVIISE